MKTANNRFDVRGLSKAQRQASASLALWLAIAFPALAANTLKDVSYTAAAGGKVDITLKFDQPVGQVQAFTTDTPPRIAIDLPDTTNALVQRRVAIGSGATSAVSAAEVSGKTRIVVDLFRPAGYTTRSDGNNLIITVDGAGGAVAAASADPVKRAQATVSVANVDFRRGNNGSGQVVLKFSGDGAVADMRTEGNQIVVDVPNASVPENLRKRLDVTDFATPVTSIEPRSNAGSTRLVINTAGGVESMAYQTGTEYIVEISPKRGAAIASAAAVGQVKAGASGTRYSGRPVTFNFQDVPVRTVLQLIAEETNINIVSSDSVAGNLTLRLVNVPWDQALDIILRAKNLDKRREGNVIWIGQQKEIADYEQAREDARIALENRAETDSEFIQINYHSATAIVDALMKANQSGSGGSGGGQNQQNGFLSPRGRMVADDRTNTILVQDIPKKITELKQLIDVIDRPVDQVLIEARVVVATDTFARELGVRMGLTGTRTGNSSTTVFSGNNAGASATWNSIVAAAQANSAIPAPNPLQVPTYTTAPNVDLGVVNPAGSIAFSIINGGHILDLELSAMETQGKGEVISNPRVITTNQREALIRQGDEVGYITVANTGGGNTGAPAQATVQFKEALLEMRVTPTITQDSRVGLNINVKKDEISGFVSTASGDVPSLQKREVNTAVLIDDGQTVVIGGVYEFKKRDDVTKVPFLADVPFLGNLFKKRGKTKEKAELLIFVTPRILRAEKR